MDHDEMHAAYKRAVDVSLRGRTRDTLHLLTEVVSRDEEGRDVRDVCFEAGSVIRGLLTQVDELVYWAYEGAACGDNRGSLLAERMLLKLNEGVYFGSRV